MSVPRVTQQDARAPAHVLGSVADPYAGRLADRRGPVLPATAGLAIQVAG